MSALAATLTLHMAELPLSEAGVRESLAALHADSFGWAMACCGRDRAEAEDVLQRAYLRILEGKARFRGNSTFRTFVFGVIRMTAREERRRQTWFVYATLDASLVKDAAALPDDALCVCERRDQLVAALAQLSVRQREVLELVFYHEMTIEEAAVVMNVGVGTARTHYERGKARLRTLLPRELSPNE